MFNRKDDYYNAIKHAQIYKSRGTKLENKKFFILNFLFLALLAYLTFTYLVNNTNNYSLPISKQAVLGVSETVDDFEVSDERLMKILQGTEVDVLQNSMKVLVNEPSIQSKSSYMQAIASDCKRVR